jgi:hypothetical protein
MALTVEMDHARWDMDHDMLTTCYGLSDLLDESGRTCVALPNGDSPFGSSATERTFFSAREHKTLCSSLICLFKPPL